MYKNYGDYDFFQYGVLVDDTHSDTELNILYCKPFDDFDENGNEVYYFSPCTVDITDTWIDKKGVMNFIGMTKEKFNNIYYAIGCIEYYGIDNFKTEGYYQAGCGSTREEIENELKHYFIASDRLDITW